MSGDSISSSSLDEQTSVDDLFGKKRQMKSHSTQTEIVQRDHVPVSVLKSFSLESLAFPKALQHSHNIFFMILGLIAVMVSNRLLKEDDSDSSIRNSGLKGFFFAIGMIILYGVLYFPNSIIQRPHPVFWRLVNAAGVGWLLVVTFANFLNKIELQRFLQIAVDPTLGKDNYVEQSYALECQFHTPGHPQGNFFHFTSNFTDMYFFAHFLGWFFKMIALRNFWISQFQSIIFEIIELSLKTWLDNFAECWWDSIILDLIIANTGGMLAGWAVIKICKMQEITIKEYAIFSSSKRFLYFIGLLVLQNLIDLSHFFNKFAIKIPQNHNLLAVRIFTLGFLVIPAFKECFVFITDNTSKRIGQAAWCFLAILFMEWNLFFLNYDPKDYQEGFPTYIVVFWCCLAFIIIVIFIVLFIIDIKRFFRSKCQKKQKQLQKQLKKKSL